MVWVFVVEHIFIKLTLKSNPKYCLGNQDSSQEQQTKSCLQWSLQVWGKNLK